jgi:hypothetical protein
MRSQDGCDLNLKSTPNEDTGLNMTNALHILLRVCENHYSTGGNGGAALVQNVAGRHARFSALRHDGMHTMLHYL